MAVSRGTDPSLVRRLRCFIGLPLPESWQEGLARVTQRLSGELRSRINWTRPGNGHLTLKFVGAVDPLRLPDLRLALGAVIFAPFAVAVGQAGVFPASSSAAGVPAGQASPRALWAGLRLGGPECARLAAKIDQALTPLGFVPEPRPFTAHLTLGRVKEAAKGEDWALPARAVADESWPVAEVCCFVLWQSVLGPGGPQYSRLAEFPAQAK
jgi:2'-5' RNA ligase